MRATASGLLAPGVSVGQRVVGGDGGGRGPGRVRDRARAAVCAHRWGGHLPGELARDERRRSAARARRLISSASVRGAEEGYRGGSARPASGGGRPRSSWIQSRSSAFSASCVARARRLRGRVPRRSCGSVARRTRRKARPGCWSARSSALAFLLAVTMGMASDRFDTRRGARPAGGQRHRHDLPPRRIPLDTGVGRSTAPARVRAAAGQRMRSCAVRRPAARPGAPGRDMDPDGGARTGDAGLDVLALFIESLNETIDLQESARHRDRDRPRARVDPPVAVRR